jgi:GTPase SAR1 family protein
MVRERGVDDGVRVMRVVGTCECSGSHGAIVVYDITSSTSFERAKMWINELREHLGRKVSMASLCLTLTLTPSSPEGATQE